MKPARSSTDVLFLGNGDEGLELDQRHRGFDYHGYADRRHAFSVLDRCTKRALNQGIMAIMVHDAATIARMREAGRAAAATLAEVGGRLRTGMSTAEIDAIVREDTARRGAKPSQLGYKGFPAAVCTSRNEVVCHGIPSRSVLLREGDIVNVDVTSELDGVHGDCSITFMIGQVRPQVAHLVETTRRCRDLGIETAGPGVRLGDIGTAIEELARREGFEVVREFGGHGIGRRMHMPPHVPHHGPAGQGPRLRPGMALTIEPMLTFGRPGIEVLADGWTAVTSDGSWSAQFEHTIVITEHGAEVLTVAPG